MEDKVEDEATQPATQLMMDPRRLGQGNSELKDEDASDIFCILHPSSIPAYKAASLIYQDTPQHTISTDRGEVKIREKVEGPHREHDEVGTIDLATQGIHSCDIALRLSSNLKNVALGGFLFGRNKSRCDIVLGQEDEVKRISNIHFRIYINEFGIIMLEDQSTNGTVVDNVLLRAKDKENGTDFRHTLEQGAIITLTMTPPEVDFRFIVRIPQRDDAAETAYNVNLTNYFFRQNRAQAEREERINAVNARQQPPDIFGANEVGTPNQSVSSVGRYIKEWRGGLKYNKVGKIGKGAFAVVYMVTAKFDGVPFAAKELEKRRFMKNGVLDQKVDMEMQIMSKIQHQNIVKYVEHIDWEEYLYIIMEYIPGGDLSSLINKERVLPEHEVKMMATQLLSALGYLHKMGITHRDVKPDNILIYARNPLTVKLTDFGLSKMVDSEETFLRTFCGTLLYCAPEVYSEYREYDASGQRNLRGIDRRLLPPQRYGHAVDIWSLAGVLFYSLCGAPPYPAKNGITYQELLNHIMSKPLNIAPLQMAYVTDRGIRFIRSMLHINPEYRATIAELESDSWLTGEPSAEPSLDSFDEVDMVGDYPNSQIEKGASQLSIHEPVDLEIDDSQGNVSDLTELQQQEIPSSFDTSDNSLGDNYGFTQNQYNGAGNGNARLFGEVDPSALGSSGAIPILLPRPEIHMNTKFPSHSFSRQSIHEPDFPTPQIRMNTNFRSHSFSRPSLYEGEVPRPDVEMNTKFPSHSFSRPSLYETEAPQSEVELNTKFPSHPFSRPSLYEPTEHIQPNTRRLGIDPEVTVDSRMPPPEIRSPQVPQINLTKTLEIDERAIRSSSLMGAESMVGHLNMRSPSDAGSPEGIPTELATEVSDAGVSLRRRREESYDSDDSWHPFDLPKPKRRKSAREIDLTIPKAVFWDPKDRSTHHDNYPTMSMSDFKAFEEYAKMKGEKFVHGQSTFDATMRSFRSSRSPSLEPEAMARAHSEPTQDEGRHMLMKRDDRKLDEQTDFISSQRPTMMKDQALPATARGSREPDTSNFADGAGTNIPAFTAQPVVGNDFQPPKRILGKIISTSDSCLPTITLNVTETVTSWGRGYKNIIRYSNGQDIRVPKYAFKIFLFKPNFYNVDGSLPNNVTTGNGKNSSDQDMLFYISTKARWGIFVNKVKIPSHDPQNPYTPARNWGELYHGDIITVWTHDQDNSQFTRFRFECYWGKSKEPRAANNPFHMLPNGDLLEEVEYVCLAQEKEMLAEKERREEEEKLTLAEEKKKPQPLHTSVNLTQSFMGAPASL